MAESSVLLPIKNNPKLCIQNATLIHVGTSNDHFYGQSQCRHGQSTVLPKGLICLFTTRIPQILENPCDCHPFLIAWIPSCYYFKIFYFTKGIDFSYYRWRRNRACYLKRVNDKIEYREKGFREEFQIRNYLNYYAPLIFTLVCQSLKEYQHRYLKRWPLITPL
jgi:hypothetical protein